MANQTGKPVHVELYNSWTGAKDTTLTTDKAAEKLSVRKDELIGIYVDGISEIKILTHPETKVTITDSTIETDELNRYVIIHNQWVNEVATGETNKFFTWPNHLKHPFIADWKELDESLYAVFNGKSIDNSKTLSLGKHSSIAYAGAFMLLDKLVDTSGLFVTQHVQHVINILQKLKLHRRTEQLFLERYFYPYSYNLRNDSAIAMLKTLNIQAGETLQNRLNELKHTSKFQPGSQFPKISGQLVTQDSTTTNYHTSYTIIDFWATWCIPCIKQLPEMEALAKQNQGKITFISISVDKQRDFNKWKSIAEKPTSIIHIWMPDAELFREKYDIKGLPRMILLDSEGKIIDPDFPHLNHPLATKWVKQLAQ